MEATQLAAAGAGEDDDVDATQPASDADKLESTQPAADSGPACARFVRVGGRDDVRGPEQFMVSWKHNQKVEVGRAAVARPEEPGVTRVVLCDSNAQGVSRQHAWLRFDRQLGLQFTVCADSTQAVTFINGQHLRSDAPTMVLKDGDKLGFGGASVDGPDNNTIVYEAHFVDMPELVQMPPPPPPAKRTRDDEEGAGAPAEQAEKPRERGESSRAARKRRKGAEAAAETATAPPAAKVAGGLAAQAALGQEHAALVAPLSSGQRKWARKGLDCAARCYGLMQEAVQMAAEEEGDGMLHTAIVRMLHTVQNLAGDSARAQQGERDRARTEQRQHEMHDHAAQRRNHRNGSGGRGQGGGGGGGGKGGKGGGGKGGGGKGGGGKGGGGKGGGGKGGGGGGRSRRW